MDIPGTLAVSELDRLRLEAASDGSLRKRLLKDPGKVLAERGVEIPEGVEIHVVEDSLSSHTITLPPFVGGDLSREALQAQVGGDPSTWWCLTCTTTSPICAGSLASLICVTVKC